MFPGCILKSAGLTITREIPWIIIVSLNEPPKIGKAVSQLMDHKIKKQQTAKKKHQTS
jgi:hypothetical protein